METEGRFDLETFDLAYAFLNTRAFQLRLKAEKRGWQRSFTRFRPIQTKPQQTQTQIQNENNHLVLLRRSTVSRCGIV